MGKPRRDLDLAQEALGTQGLCQLGAQDLDRHPALVLGVLRLEDEGHAAPPQLTLQPVARRQDVDKRTKQSVTAPLT